MDWPVAKIPTTPVANHPTGVLIPIRWPHHGDLRVLVDDLEVFISADDLYALAELEAEGDVHPHPQLTPDVTWSKNPGDPLLHMYTLTDAIAVLEHTPTHQTGELLEWMRISLPLHIREEAIDAAIGLESFLDAYTVSQAARILDGDPAVSIGQKSLFKHLDYIGWATRDLAGQWHPNRVATRAGFLTIRDVLIRHGKHQVSAYPQIYVTAAGLAELRRTLHALWSAPPGPAEPETLPIPD
jgi:hypothetical protein